MAPFSRSSAPGRTRTRRGRVPAVIALAAAAAACAGEPAPADQELVVTIAAAASLGNALAEIAAAFEQEHPGVRLRLSLAGSGTLQRQIERGAPVDVFVSAAPLQMEALERAGRVLPSTRRDVAANELVLVVPVRGSTRVHTFRDLADPRVERVAIGAPASVPAGRYAEQVLRSEGVSEAVLDKAVQAQHTRQVLSYVEMGEVDAGIVYRTDAASSSRVRVVATAPPGSHDPVRYPAAVVAGTRHPAEARELVEFLTSGAARAVLRRHGFPPAPGAATPAPPPR